jgi:hypothetical protein
VKGPVEQHIQQRVIVSRRCAWCLRFCVNGTWIEGRRAADQAMVDSTTHTICEECLESLRQRGMSV